MKAQKWNCKTCARCEQKTYLVMARHQGKYMLQAILAMQYAKCCKKEGQQEQEND